MMKQRRLAVLAGLALFATAPTSAIEVVYDSYSPVSIAKNSRAVVTLDDDGLVRRVEEYLYVTPDRHFIPEPDDRPLELFLTTVVEDVPGGLRMVRTDADGVVEDERSYRFADGGRIVFEGWGSEWEIALGEQNAAYCLTSDDGTRLRYRREGDRVTVTGIEPEGITETYDWGGNEYLYTKVRAYEDRRMEAFAIFYPDDDLIVVERPQEDGPSPYEWRYDVYNARALLAQRFTRVAAAINEDLLGGRGFDGMRLLPLFAIDELGE
ncbi:MAG: hypothetical protein ACOCWX_04755 [Spirochaetota bacterium]